MYKPVWPCVDTERSVRGEMRRGERKRPTRRRIIRALVVAVVFETTSLWLRSGKLGGNIVVRCREGHLFTTIWIPAVSVKALRLGPWRIQRCPLGGHWTVVTPVREAELSPEQLADARAHHDRRLP
jgi:hypothetical protein